MKCNFRVWDKLNKCYHCMLKASWGLDGVCDNEDKCKFFNTIYTNQASLDTLRNKLIEEVKNRCAGWHYVVDIINVVFGVEE